MFINKIFNNIKIICITTDKRKDRKKWMKKQCNRRKIDIEYYSVKMSKDKRKGCLESHLDVIRKYYTEFNNNNSYPYLMIIEDDAKFLHSITKVSLPPEKWDMLYLGGTVIKKWGDVSEKWIRMTCWNCHAYILDLRNKKIIRKILDAKKQKNKKKFREFDKYLIDEVHKNFLCFMHNPMIISQKNGYSDMKNKKLIIN